MYISAWNFNDSGKFIGHVSLADPSRYSALFPSISSCVQRFRFDDYPEDGKIPIEIIIEPIANYQNDFLAAVLRAVS